MSDWNRVLILRRLRWPALLLLTGIIALLDQIGILSWDHAWPLYLILLGVMMLAERAAMASLAADPYTGFSGYPNAGYPGYPNAGYPNPGQPVAGQTNYGQTGPATSATQPSQPGPDAGSIVPVSPWTALAPATGETPAAPASRWSQDGEREGEEPHQ